MENSVRIAGPLPPVRPRNAHRFEVFSPKLGRRLTFFRRAALDQWVLLEADPCVKRFCERPGYIHAAGAARLADFWVEFADHQELVILSETLEEADISDRDVTLYAAMVPVRHVTAGEIAAARAWIDNWRRMLPCMVASRGLVPPGLMSAIERFVCAPQKLLAVEREFSAGDPTLVRAALYGLMHAGRVVSPDLRTASLSLLTSFVTAGTSP
ncbi:conserved protein of unknown function (plasmid) [Paraburkholderia kururiensis]|uniref:hypothetical protein n=1 Tax=Paraburkholderia kururiensis TaxID=984307 RepID=UPI0039A69FF8